MLSTLDVVLIAAFVLYAAWSGLSSREKASQNLEEYFLAGRTLSGWKSGISMAATQFAADTPLLVTGLIASQGIFSLWRLWIYGIAFLLMGYLLAPCWRRANVLTDAEFAEFRYEGKSSLALRGFKAVYFGTIFNCTVLAMVLLATTRIAEPFLLWNQWLPAPVFESLSQVSMWFNVSFTLSRGPDAAVLSANNFISIVGILSLTAFYSTTGGLRSVVNTDQIQFFLALFASLAFMVTVVLKVGGVDVFPQKLQELWQGGAIPLTPDQVLAFTPLTAKDVTIPVLAMLALQWIIQINSDGTGYLAQRTMACRSDKDARFATIVFTVSQILFRSLIWLPLGVGLLILYPPSPAIDPGLFAADREFTYVKGMTELLPSGLLGLMLVGMLAALTSTVDTHLNWGASYWTNDIFDRIICRAWLKRQPGRRELVTVARLSNILILAVAFAILPFLSSLQQAWQTSLLLGSGVGIILVLRWIWWRITAQGELAAIACSFALSTFVLMVGSDWSEPLRLLLVAGGSTLAGIFVSFKTEPKSKARLREFYQRVQPPGFWAPVAQPGHDPARKLSSGLHLTFVTGLAVFFLLVGIGAMIVKAPTPLGTTWRWLWISLCLITGVALGLGTWRRWQLLETKEYPPTKG
jgi:Na+/proline symporter